MTAAENEPGAEPRTQPSATVTGTKRFVSKTIIDFWLDMFLLVLLMVLSFQVAVLQFVFPIPQPGVTAFVWGGSLFHWRQAHFATFCVFGGSALLHIMLHWTWICGVINTRLFGRKVIPTDGTETLIGVIAIVGLLHLLGLGVLAAMWSVKEVGV